MVIFLSFLSCSTDDPKTKVETITQVATWCESVLGGEVGRRAWQNDFAKAHVGQRLFGPQPDWVLADEILSADLYGVSDLPDFIPDYADAFEHTCFATATDSAVGSQVELRGNIAVIQPGNDSPSLPEGTEHIVIDLRSIGHDADVMSAAGLAFASDQNLGSRYVRRFLGFPSQDDGWTHYEQGMRDLDETLIGLGDSDRPLSFLTGPLLSPEAALIVASLRTQNKAQLLGYNVYSAVAESTWTGIEGNGLMWRSSQLSVDGNTLPDLILADHPVSSIDEAIEHLSGSVSAQDGEVTRSEMGAYARDAEPTARLGDGERRAALLIAYGTLDWFYPYFDVVGRDIDDALLNSWLELDQISDGDRMAMMHSLGRLMHSIYDGHGFYSDWAGTDWPDGYLGIQIEPIDGEPVVRSSVHPDLNPGDTITEIEGQSAVEWYEEAMTRYSAASDGYRFVQASYELKDVHGARELQLRAPDGSERTVSAAPQDYYDSLGVAWGGTLRPSGWLEDLSAPTVFYVNMSGEVTPEMAPIIDQFDEILDASGVILDMRDYPYLHIYEFARYFNPGAFTAPHFGFPTWAGPSNYSMPFEIWDFNSGPKVYTGPIMMLVSNKSVSAAECFAQMLFPLENVTVVGQVSASTNGTITNAWLPGQLQITFTGMDLKNLDGSDFHGIGVIPDVVVSPTAQDFADGVDPELQTAIDLLME